VALFSNESSSERADVYLRNRRPSTIVSDFAAAEFASVIARRVRMQQLSRDQAHAVFETFDDWLARNTQRAEMQPSDVTNAAIYLRRLDLALRTPDALHIAIAQRLGASLATFDERMAAGARTLGLDVAEI